MVNERDELGPNLVPDYLTSVREGAFYGWPYSYWGQHVDERVKPQDPEKVASAIAPDYALGSHVAALGLSFSSPVMGARYAEGAFVGEHGSWNRSPPVGYKVVFVPFRGGRPAGAPPLRRAILRVVAPLGPRPRTSRAGRTARGTRACPHCRCAAAP